MSKKIVLSDNKLKLSLTCSAEIIAINVDLLTEILLRVPAKPLIRFKSVSKQWLSLISDARFCRKHTRKNPSPPISGLYFYPNRPERDRSLSLNTRLNAISVCDHPGTSLPSFSFMEDSGPGSPLSVVHSSNGLMLCTFWFSSYAVCNLTTQKFVLLPKLAAVSKSQVWFLQYLIYDPKKSPYYRVVVASNSYDHLGTSQFDVYSSESGSWKSTVANPGISNSWMGHGAVWNGAILWMHCGPGPESCSEHDHFYFRFDIDAETPSTTGVPSPGTHSNLIMYFGECGGHLLLIQIPRHYATEFRVLEMNIEGENKFRWTVKYSVDLRPLKLPRSISYGFSVLSVMNVGANENDLAVVLDGGGKVIQYNIEGKTSRVLCYLGFGDDFLFSTSNPLRCSYHFIESLTPV